MKKSAWGNKGSAWQNSEQVLKDIAELMHTLDDIKSDNTASSSLKAGAKMTISKLSAAMATLRSAIKLHNG